MVDIACKEFKLDDVIKCGLSLTKSELKILKFLVNNQDAYTSNDISKEIGLDLTTSQRALKNLREKNLIRRMQRNLSPGGYIFLYSVSDRDNVKKQLMEIINSWVKELEREINAW